MDSGPGRPRGSWRSWRSDHGITLRASRSPGLVYLLPDEVLKDITTDLDPPEYSLQSASLDRLSDGVTTWCHAYPRLGEAGGLVQAEEQDRPRCSQPAVVAQRACWLRRTAYDLATIAGPRRVLA